MEYQSNSIEHQEKGCSQQDPSQLFDMPGAPRAKRRSKCILVMDGVNILEAKSHVIQHGPT